MVLCVRLPSSSFPVLRPYADLASFVQASSKEGKDGGIEFVDPPAGSKPGDRVYFEGFETEIALDILNPKKKIWEAVQPGSYLSLEPGGNTKTDSFI